MAVLETIRVKFGVLITVLIAIALLSFIVDFNSLSSAITSSSSKFTVGKINGNKISYKDFQEQVEYQTRIAELVNGNAASEEVQRQIRDAAWQHFIDQDLFLKRAKAAGIEVGQEEMLALAGGDMVSPVLIYNPAFGNPDGSFNREAFMQFINSLSQDESGNARMYWDYLQNQINTQQYYIKYGSLFAASDMDNSLTLQDALEGNNVSASIESIMVPYPYVKDSTIVVPETEVKQYYKRHKEDYKQKASREVEYAEFEVVPSSEDFDNAKKAVDEVYEEFAKSENLKNFIMRNSERPFDTYYYKAGELNFISPEVNDFVFSGSTGTSPVIKEGNSYMAVRVADTKNMPDSVFVRHILIQTDDHLADSLFNVVTKDRGQFEQLALIYSADKNPNAATPGEIGWMTQSYMIPGMESVLFAEVNKPFVLETRYGKHIVEVTKKTKLVQKKQVAILEKTAVPSKSTMNIAYNKANTLATKAGGKLDGLQNAAKEENVYLAPMSVSESTANYGSAPKSKEVTRWVFDAKKGEASNVITVNQNFLFVVGVKEIHKEGYATLDEVRSSIVDRLYNQMLADKCAADLAEKIKDCQTIQDAAEVLGQTPTKSEDVTFAALTSRDNEPAVLGAVASAETGKLVGPVKGTMGIYVLTVNDRQTLSHYTEEDAKANREQKVQYSAQMLLPVMFETSGSVDNRERFY